MKKQKIAYHDVTAANDIKYRGPLSYRTLRIIGWIAMAIAQMSVIAGIMAKKWDPATHDIQLISNLGEVFTTIGHLSVPLFLVANFALILQSRENIKKLVLTHLAGAAGIYVGFLLLYSRYLSGYAQAIFGVDFREVLDSLVASFFAKRLNFNVFIDLLIFSSMFFFLTYQPTKIFKGKKIIIFRLFTIFPIAYEILCIVLKGLSQGKGLFTIPTLILPLVTTKPVFMFLAFLSIIIFIKVRQFLFLRKGKTMKEYHEFLDTNTNSWHLSVFIAVAFASAAVLDVFTVGMINAHIINTVPVPEGMTDILINYFVYSVQEANAWSVGQSTPLLLGAPIVLLFSYTRKYSLKSKQMDQIIPFIGIGLIVLVYLEGILMYLTLK